MSDQPSATLDLRPFQQHALDAFFSGRENRLLIAPLGTGKGITASAIVAEAIARGGSGIAVLAATHVGAQGIAWRAAGAGLTPFELSKALPSGLSASSAPRWPERVLAFGSLRHAERDPIAEAFRAKHWNLLVADLSGASEADVNALRKLVEKSRIDRVLLVADDASDPSNWSWLDAARLPLEIPAAYSTTAPRALFSTISYERVPEEIDLESRALQLATTLRRLGLKPDARLVAAVLSSPLAGQSQAWATAKSVQQLRNRLVHGLEPHSQLSGGVEANFETISELDALHDALVRLGDDVDFLPVDSKWEAFRADIDQRDRSGIVVFSDFTATAGYVIDRLTADGVGAMQIDDAKPLPQLADAEHPVLVCTDSRLLGIDLRYARVAYNYDLPRSKRRAHVRWSRLDWSRVDPPVEMVALLDRKTTSPTERMAFAQLRHLVGELEPS